MSLDFARRAFRDLLAEGEDDDLRGRRGVHARMLSRSRFMADNDEPSSLSSDKFR